MRTYTGPRRWHLLLLPLLTTLATGYAHPDPPPPTPMPLSMVSLPEAVANLQAQLGALPSCAWPCVRPAGASATAEDGAAAEMVETLEAAAAFCRDVVREGWMGTEGGVAGVAKFVECAVGGRGPGPGPRGGVCASTEWGVREAAGWLMQVAYACGQVRVTKALGTVGRMAAGLGEMGGGGVLQPEVVVVADGGGTGGDNQTTTTEAASGSEASGKLSKGSVVGIGVGVAAAVAVLAGVGVVASMRRCRKVGPLELDAKDESMLHDAEPNDTDIDGDSLDTTPTPKLTAIPPAELLSPPVRKSHLSFNPVLVSAWRGTTLKRQDSMGAVPTPVGPAGV
ncbi:hypothetical protein HDU96_005010 [Phlyctochytrium bullatum]|nr:hypothetical protein HDU96_005010 [Phlyctochytrium bullatum]